VDRYADQSSESSDLGPSIAEGQWSGSWLGHVPELPLRDVIGRWKAALVEGDADEVERLVKQGRAARIVSSRLGTAGPMLDSIRPAARHGVPEEH
jgi:hypothetical protein